MAKEPITTRLDADTKQEVENYADEHDIGQTEATRRLIRSGLASEGHPVAATDGGNEFLERLASPRTATVVPTLTLLAALSMAGAGFVGQSGGLLTALALLVLATVLLAAAAVVATVVALAQLALARPLRELVFRSGETA